MRTVEDYRKRAQCVELAQKACASERQTLMEIAQTWIKLANARETELRIEKSEPSKP